jgi:hypothetical protein
MNSNNELRESLARHIREGRLLRAPLRLSVRAAEERRHQQQRTQPGANRPEAVGRSASPEGTR